MSKGMHSSSYRRWMAGLLLALPFVMCPLETCVAAPAEVHGSLDAYATPGVALAWGILRAKDEAATEVVVRIDADAGTYRTVAVAGVDPFTKASQPLVAATPIGGTLLVHLPRSRFAELPRTEWRFFASATPAAADTPTLLVYYQGIPDTTPEFDDAAKLAASLAERIERARRELKAKGS